MQATNPILFDLKTIWKDVLLPLTKTKEIEELLHKHIVLNNYMNNDKESDAYWADKRNQWDTFFRLPKEDFDKIRETPKPWLYYPLAVFSPTEQEPTKGTKHYQSMKESYDEFMDIMKRGKSPEDIEWWCYLHRCETINGIILIRLLRMAYPQKKFRLAENPLHWFIVDELDQIYDLYWPQVGMPVENYYLNPERYLNTKLKITYYDEFPLAVWGL